MLRIADAGCAGRLYCRGRHVAESDVDRKRFLRLISYVLREYSLASEAELETIGESWIASRNALDVPRIELRRDACPRALLGSKFKPGSRREALRLPEQIVRSGVVFSETLRDDEGDEISLPRAEWIGTTAQLHALLCSEQSRLDKLEKEFLSARHLAYNLANYGFERGDNAVSYYWLKGRRNWCLRKAGFES